MKREDPPDSEELAVEWELAVTSPSLGGTLPQASAGIRRRRERRWGDFSEETARLGGVTVDDVIDRLSAPGDDDGVSLLEQAAEAAIRTADRRKIEMLARVSAAAFSGDDAVIQGALLVLPVVVELGPAHVRLMVEIELRHRVEPIPLDKLQHLSDDPSAAETLVAQLVAKGILSLVVQPTGSDPPSAVTLYQMSAFGHQALRYLHTALDDGERPELRAT